MQTLYVLVTVETDTSDAADLQQQLAQGVESGEVVSAIRGQGSESGLVLPLC